MHREEVVELIRVEITFRSRRFFRYQQVVQAKNAGRRKMTGAIFGALLHDDEIVAKIRAWPFETVLQLRAASVGERRAAGLRLTRSKLLAKGPHSGGHWLGKKLDNGKTSGRPPTFSPAFWKNLGEKWSTLNI